MPSLLGYSLNLVWVASYLRIKSLGPHVLERIEVIETSSTAWQAATFANMLYPLKTTFAQHIGNSAKALPNKNRQPLLSPKCTGPVIMRRQISLNLFLGRKKFLINRMESHNSILILERLIVVIITKQLNLSS